VLVKAPDGGIMGVHSRSESDRQISLTSSRATGNSRLEKKYSDWKFVYSTTPQTNAFRIISTVE
jgi:hypothetical protein